MALTVRGQFRVGALHHDKCRLRSLVQSGCHTRVIVAMHASVICLNQRTVNMFTETAVRFDRVSRFQSRVHDVAGRHFLIGRETLINGLVPPDGSCVLEVGCGTGRTLVAIARRFPSCRLYGFDVSERVLATAQRNIQEAGLSQRVTLAMADAVTFDGMTSFGVPTFDRVVASYVLSMIPDWLSAMKNAVSQLSPGGSLHVIDFGGANGMPMLAQGALHGLLRRLDVTVRADLKREASILARRARLTAFCTDLHLGYAQYAVLSRG